MLSGERSCFRESQKKKKLTFPVSCPEGYYFVPRGVGFAGLLAERHFGRIISGLAPAPHSAQRAEVSSSDRSSLAPLEAVHLPGSDSTPLRCFVFLTASVPI